LHVQEKRHEQAARHQHQEPEQQEGLPARQAEEEGSAPEGHSYYRPPAQLLLDLQLSPLVRRAVDLLPQLQPFELAQLVHGFAALGTAEARSVFMAAPDDAARKALGRAAQRASLPELVGLLWAMARWGCYPSPAFGRVAGRLRGMSSQYRFSPHALVTLGEALSALPSRQRAALGLRPELQHAAIQAARDGADQPDSVPDSDEGADAGLSYRNGASSFQMRGHVPTSWWPISAADQPLQQSWHEPTSTEV
jgi:hypothetical protein